MRRIRRITVGELVVTEYEELRRFATAFAHENYDLLIVVGSGGTGKTEAVKRTMDAIHGTQGWSLIKGKHTPLDLYAKLYQARLKPVVVDDLDGLLSSPDNSAILKCVCETTPVKRVAWGSHHPVFRGKHAAISKSFDSISKVCLIANDLGHVSKNIQALETRGIVLAFRPTAMEVHREIAGAGWFDDEEVFDFLGEHLHLVTRPNLRLYVVAKAHKQAGLDWRGLTLRTLQVPGDENLLRVARLLANPDFDALAGPEAARADAFAQEGGGSRATYFRQKAKLLERRGQVDVLAATAMRLVPVRRDPQWYARRELEEHLRALRRKDGNVAGTRELRAGSPNDSRTDPTCQVELLQAELQAAIRAEQFERAAMLRDQIRRLTNG